MRAGTLFLFALLSFSVTQVLSAQSLVDVAKKEKQRRSVDSKKTGDDVIDEYTLAGYKGVNAGVAKEKSKSAKREAANRDTAGQPSGSGDGEVSEAADKAPTSLEARTKRACDLKPDGIVCASLRKRLEKTKTPQ